MTWASPRIATIDSNHNFAECVKDELGTFDFSFLCVLNLRRFLGKIGRTNRERQLESFRAVVCSLFTESSTCGTIPRC